MRLLVGINNNPHEWHKALVSSPEQPRLPLPYGFGSAFYQRGHQLSAVNLSPTTTEIPPVIPFEKIYQYKQLVQAMNAADIVLLWAGSGISATLKQPFLKNPKRRVLLASYVWKLDTLPNWRMRKLGIATHLAARFARGVVVMTSEQFKLAKQTLCSSVPVLQFTCGIDTRFYKSSSSFTDVPEIYQPVVENLLAHPYAIMPGDEQRCNQHALDILARSNLRLVRICQYSTSKNASWFRQQICDRGLTDRCFFFERIGYPFMRFLLHNASVYAGLVDSTWQPAGWTVACEALASGLPLILYEGLVSRELQNLGAGKFLQAVPMGNTQAFQAALEAFADVKPDSEVAERGQHFAANQLDLESTGERFVKHIEELICS